MKADWHRWDFRIDCILRPYLLLSVFICVHPWTFTEYPHLLFLWRVTVIPLAVTMDQGGSG